MGKGLRHDPLADIEIIRQNLKDRYTEEFPILKELVQNADDAGAAHVTFVWTPGLPTVRHALLQGPGLIAINDGRFTAADRDAIRMMGLSDKLRERNAIGKFGLGLKSVFHLCEAFFYVAGRGDSEEVDGDILNPWSGEAGMRSLHSDWDEFKDEDRAAIVGHLLPFLSTPTWFCLWIPLRCRSHVGSITPIQPAYPGDSIDIPAFLDNADVVQRLADTLPLLANVERMRLILLGTPGRRETITTIALDDGYSRRTHRRDAQMEIGTQALHGHIRCGSASTATFWGDEALASDSTFSSLQASSFWPQATRIDRATAEQISVREKADPHGAAVFIAHTAPERGQLSISWAAFLPIGQPIASIQWSGDWHFSLLLHGDFFVDPGRNRPDLGDGPEQRLQEDATRLRRSWNRQLAERVVFPRVLRALDGLAQGNLGHEVIANLSGALWQAFSSHELLPWRAALCREHQWAYCLDADGGTWRLLPTDRPVIGLPRVLGEDGDLPHSLFPALRAVTQHQHITVEGMPRITRDTGFHPWPTESLLAMLDLDVRIIFSRVSPLDYLVRFLDLAGTQVGAAQVQERLAGHARRALLEVGLDSIRRHRRTFGLYLHHVKPDRLLRLRFESSGEDDEIAYALLRAPSRLVPIPAEFLVAPGDLGGTLATEDAVALLHALADAAVEYPEGRGERIGSIAMQILEYCGERRRDVMERCADASLLPVYDCRRGQAYMASWSDLAKAHALGGLFTNTETSGAAELGSALQAALPETRVLLIERRVAQAAFGPSIIPLCTIHNVATLLLAAPSLARPNDRVRLLASLLATAAGPQGAIAPAVRYLLHGSVAHIQDEAILLTSDHATDSGVWGKLAEQALRLLGAGWRLIPPVLSELVPAVRRRSLPLVVVDAESVAQLLVEAGPERIRGDELTPQERELVVRDLGDESVLRRLAIHSDREGNLHAIGARTYLESDFRVGAPFVPLVTLVRQSERPDVLYKQRRLMDPWTGRTAIRFALEQVRPEGFAVEILDGLQSLRARNDLASDLWTMLKTTPWIPARDGGAFAPEYVLHIPGMEDEIAPLIAAGGGLLAGAWSIAPAIAQHPAFTIISERFLPDHASVLGMLGELIREDDSLSDYRIGQIRLERGDVDPFLEAFQVCPDHLLRALPLLSKARSLVGVSQTVEHLLPGLTGAIPGRRMIDILEFLVDAHQNASPMMRAACLKVHCAYLESSARAGGWDVLPHIRLLNARQQWRPSAQLCSLKTEGIDAAWVVGEAHFTILEQLLPGNDLARERATSPAHSDAATNTAETAEPLRQYFRRWEERCPRPIIGGFLSVLGDGPVRALAEDYFDKRGSVATARGQLEWKPIRGASSPGWGASDSPGEVMRMQSFRITFHDPVRDGGVRVQNLLAQPIVVPLSETFEHLLLGEHLAHTTINTPLDVQRTDWFTLRVIEPGRYTEQDLSRLLRETSRRILRDVYMQASPNLDAMWDGLQAGEQKEIRIAQVRLAESLFLYVRQLGLHKERALADLLGRWERAQRQRTETEDLQNADGKRLHREAEAAIREIREELTALLSGDPEIQRLFLAAVRERIERHYQYRATSIPFELFQNADDATVEWAEMLQGAPLLPNRTRIRIAASPEALAFIHGGRPINTFRRGDFDGQSRGYDADLEKMLILAASDKGADELQATVTGRFGLGFKSVFLLADRAEVLSGRLSFEVVGGLFPRALEPDRRDQLREQIASSGIETAEGTIISLPTDGAVTAEVVLSPFRALVHILLVFSRAIKTCELPDERGRVVSATWSEAPLEGAEGVALGRLAPLGRSGDAQSRALVFRLQSGALLVPLAPTGLSPFADDIPTIWVTAPIQAREGLGFALNAAFDLDPGRAQLASRSDHNDTLADRLGAELGNALRSLAGITVSSWPTFASKLGFPLGSTPYDFWRSVWEMFAKSIRDKGTGTEARRIITRVLWSPSEGAMPALIAHHDVIPTGLSGAYKALERRERIAMRLEGCLDTGEGVFQQVATWEQFRGRVHQGSLVAGSIAGTLSDMAPESGALEPITLAVAIAWELGSTNDVSPAMAAILGSVVTSGLLDTLQSGSKSAQSELEQVRDLLGRLRFQSVDKSYQQPVALVLSGAEDESDEARRAAFAPARCVLSSAYTDWGRDFFVLCRGREQPKSQDLARWMRDAITPQARKAALSYLAAGDLNQEVAKHLRGQLAGTWLQDLRANPLFGTLDADAAHLILALLQQYPPTVPLYLPEPSPLLADEVLALIAEWWEEQGDAELARYVARLYPNGLAPQLVTDIARLRTDRGARGDWLQLFLLGAAHSLGGVQPEQHRGFVAWCIDRGWIDAFADPHLESSAILELLKKYLESSLDRHEYYYWMRLFVPLFQLGNWLDTYIEVFLRLRHPDTGKNLGHILAPGTDPTLSGSGIDAPSLERTLGLGACFVLRELARQRTIENNAVHRHCYVPARPVRRFLQQIGATELDDDRPRASMSGTIHTFLTEHLGLESATFDGAFDIPLLILAQDPNLQLAVCGERLWLPDSLADEVPL